MYDMHNLTNVQLDYLKRQSNPVTNVRLNGNRLQVGFTIGTVNGITEIALDPIMNIYLARTHTDNGRAYQTRADTIKDALNKSLLILRHSKSRQLEHV